MAADPAIPARTCPECRAEVTREARYCWLCGGALGESADVAGKSSASPVEADSAAPVIAGPWTYSLSSLMMMVTLCAVTFGLFATEPGLGIGFAILITPSLVRTTIVAARRRKAGQPMTWAEIGWSCLASVGLLVGLITAISASVFFNCLAGLAVAAPIDAQQIGFVIGIAVGLLLPFAAAATRTIWLVQRHKAAGRPILVEEIVRFAVVSMLSFTLLELAAVAVGAMIMGLGMAFTGGDLDERMQPVMLLALCVSAGVFAGLATWLWNWKVD